MNAVLYVIACPHATLSCAHKWRWFEMWCLWSVLLKAFNDDDYIRWLNKLLQETSREPDCSSAADTDDDIYDEVYHWAEYQSNGQLTPLTTAYIPIICFLCTELLSCTGWHERLHHRSPLHRVLIIQCETAKHFAMTAAVLKQIKFNFTSTKWRHLL